jgi:hypothetical protein
VGRGGVGSGGVVEESVEDRGGSGVMKAEV